MSAGATDTLESLLRRGRGAGWHAALAQRERAREIVIQGIVDESLCDAGRAWCARLVLALEAPIARIVEVALTASDELAPFAADVCEELAIRGAPIPVALGPWHGPYADFVVAPALDPHLPTRALLAAASTAGVYAVEPILATRGGSARDREIVVECAWSHDVTVRAMAWRLLGGWGDPSMLAAIESWLDEVARSTAYPDGILTHAAAHALEALGGEAALARARAWVGRAPPHRTVADRVLAVHATEADLGTVIEHLGAAIAGSEHQRIIELCRACAAIGRPEALPAIERAWAALSVPWGREDVLGAVCAIDRDHPIVLEALWDAGVASLRLAVRHARGPIADARRRELAQDPWEDPEVRAAAAR